jgi:hypothetical protein
MLETRAAQAKALVKRRCFSNRLKRERRKTMEAVAKALTIGILVSALALMYLGAVAGDSNGKSNEPASEIKELKQEIEALRAEISRANERGENIEARQNDGENVFLSRSIDSGKSLTEQSAIGGNDSVTDKSFWIKEALLLSIGICAVALFALGVMRGI